MGGKRVCVKLVDYGFKKTMRDYKGLLRALESRKKEGVGKTMRINLQTSKVHTKEKLNVWIFLDTLS